MKCHRPRAYQFPVTLATELIPIVDSHDRIICWAPDRETGLQLAKLIRAHMPERDA